LGNLHTFRSVAAFWHDRLQGSVNSNGPEYTSGYGQRPRDYKR